MTTDPKTQTHSLTIDEQEKKVARGRFWTRLTTALAIFAFSIAIVLSQVVQLNYTSNLRNENSTLREQLSTFTEQSDCRSQITADFDVAWSDLDRLLSQGLLAVANKDDLGLSNQAAELDVAIDKMREASFRRGKAVELCKDAVEAAHNAP
jgi:hypothetical protein